MGNLRVEELEPRQLLNGAWLPLPPLVKGGWLLPPPHPDRLEAGIVSVRLVERLPILSLGDRLEVLRLPVIDFGNHAEVLDLFRPAEGGVEIAPRGVFALADAGGKELELRAHFAPAPLSVLVGWSDKLVSGPGWPRPDHLDVVPSIAAHPGTIQTTSAGFQFAPPDWAAGGRRAQTIAAEIVPPVAPETLLADPPVSANPVSDTAVETSVQVSVGAEPLSPRVSGLLTALPPVNLEVLEQGIQQFLDQLDGLSQSLHESSGPGVYPWIAAVAAAAAACEIGRRHLKPRALESIPVDNHLALSPCDESLTE